jgi:hypothetical protein
MFMNRLSCSNFTIFTLLVVTCTLHVSASQNHHQMCLFIKTCHTALVIGDLYDCTSKTYFLLLLKFKYILLKCSCVVKYFTC